MDAGHGAADAAQAGSETPVRGPSALPPVEDAQAVSLPVYSVRGNAPGLRGCWATNKHGEPCGAARRADGDYCNAHSGRGVAEDPARYAVLGAAKRAENARRATLLRMTLGLTRSSTPRGVLRAAAFVEAERIASRVLDGVLDPDVPSHQAATLGLKLLDAVDPLLGVEVTGSLPSTPEGVADLSLSQLLAVGQQLGIESTTLDAHPSPLAQ